MGLLGVRDCSSSGFGTIGLRASGRKTVRSIGLEVVSLGGSGLGRQTSSIGLLLLVVSREVRGDSSLFACRLLLEAMEKRRELARKGFVARRGESR